MCFRFKYEYSLGIVPIPSKSLRHVQHDEFYFVELNFDVKAGQQIYVKLERILDEDHLSQVTAKSNTIRMEMDQEFSLLLF